MADDLKKMAIQYGDKVLFGIFLVGLVATAALTLAGPKNPSNGDPTRLPPYKPEENTIAMRINELSTKLDRGGIPEGFVTGGFATDPDEINPRPGEIACEDCGWIMPETTKRCPNCGKWIANDDDKDGMPNDWEDRYPCVDRNVYDADEDPDGDGFTNLKEYIGGSDPCDPKSVPSPFRVTNRYRKPIDILFQGFTIKEGGDSETIDPKYWVVLINYGQNTRSKLVPLGAHFRGYRLYPLEKTKVLREPGGGIPAYHEDTYVLTIQRPGQEPVKLEKGKWGRTNETYIDLVVTRGEDSSKVFKNLTVGDRLVANGQQFEVVEISGSRVILRGSEGEIYTLY